MSCCNHGPNGGCCGEDWCQPPEPEWGENPDKPTNPNPMNSRCDLEDCDCGYVIEKLKKALKAVEWGDVGYCSACLRDDCAGHAEDCPCYQAGYERERQP